MEAGAPAEQSPSSGAPDESEWPDEADESAFLSESRARGEAPDLAGSRGAAPVIGDKVPPLDEMVERVPPALRGLLDDLFRAKFTGVRRFPGAVKPDDS